MYAIASAIIFYGLARMEPPSEKYLDIHAKLLVGWMVATAVLIIGGIFIHG